MNINKVNRGSDDSPDYQLMFFNGKSGQPPFFDPKAFGGTSCRPKLMPPAVFLKRSIKQIFGKIRVQLIAWIAIILTCSVVYYELWGKHLYLVTAYCACPICINIPKYQKDSQFASGRKIYWGGMAADPAVPFGSKVKLVPHWPQDWLTVGSLLKGRRDYVVEDRGGKIKGKHIDLFIPDSMGGHQAALHWGVRKMRVRINGKLAE